MSARQNKKQRKGRNNPNIRERTVTTLTEDPNTPYLVPTPSEDPPGALMSSPFSVASSSAANGGGPVSSAYQPPSNYEAFGYGEFGSLNPHYFPQQHQQQTKVPALHLPGANDLERLENLKNIIKAGQHSNYRPIPQPAALAAHYLGPLPTSQEQQTQYGNNTDGSSQAIPSTGSCPSSPVDMGRRPPRLSSKEWEHSSPRKMSTVNGTQPNINTNQPSQGYGGRPTAIDTTNLQASSNTTNSAGTLSAGPKSVVDIHMSDTPSTTTEGQGTSPRFDKPRPSPGNNPDPARIPADRLGHGENGYGGSRGPAGTEKGSYDSKDDLRIPRDGSWSARDGPHPDDRRRDFGDRPPPSPRTNMNGSGPGSDTRSNPGDRQLTPRDPLPRDDRYYDRDRDRDRDRDYRDRDRRDWERERRPTYDRFRPNYEASRRPPPEQRHYEPDYGDRGIPPRRYDIKEEPISDSRRLSDLRRLSSPVAEDRHPVRPDDDRPPPLSARLPPSNDPRPPVDASRPPHPETRASVAPPPRAPTPDNRSMREPSFGDRNMKPAPPLEERRGAAAPLTPDVRAPAPPVRPATIQGANRPADARRDVPLTPVESPRPLVPLEERINNRPSLQERISEPESNIVQPPPAAASRPLEERLSAIPVSADSREQRGRVPDRPPPPPSASLARPAQQPIDDRTTATRPSQPPPPQSASTQDDRRIDERPPPARYTRPMSPAGDRATYPPPLHAASSAREDPRAAKGPPPSPPRPDTREYRPLRPNSRERPGGSYRPAEDRSFVPGDRRSDAMDVDVPSRYNNDSRSIPYNRPFSPPSAADLARDRARAAQYPPPSPPLHPHPSHRSSHHDAVPYDDDRRYAPGRDWPPAYPPAYDRRREWSAADEEYYKSRQWERNAGPPPPPPASSDRDRFERDRNGGWETRDERERRDFAPPPPRAPPSPSRSYDGASRPLSSRLTDNFSSPASGGPPPNERSYPPLSARDAPPPFGRVRQRSMSPARRPGGGPIIEDTRPPAKRSRDDGYSGDYYPPPSSGAPGGRDTGGPPPPLRRPSDYPPLSRGSSPPPSSGGSVYFDNRGPPPPTAASTSGVTDREYPPRDYPPYDRPRSPLRGAIYSKPGYTSARDARDDRRYPPPPPPSSSMLPPRRP